MRTRGRITRDQTEESESVALEPPPNVMRIRARYEDDDAIKSSPDAFHRGYGTFLVSTTLLVHRADSFVENCLRTPFERRCKFDGGKFLKGSALTSRKDMVPASALILRQQTSYPNNKTGVD
ncbi:unnamed protein product [Heterotrigona itama]|uniref:Uncharacterized protein n=1 Tax=Heterotrigona itama TaxID=395501 RepID=A0A6V7HEJ7_9HYME|nr:unnamed protein product [Heterotrigona itama]